MRRHRHPACARALPDRHRHGVRSSRPLLDRAARTDRRVGRGPRRHVVDGVLRVCGVRTARDDPVGRCPADDLTFRYMQARAVTVGDVPCWALRVTYVGELGWELYPSDRVRRAPVGHAARRPVGHSAWCPAATAPSTRCGSRRATGSGAADITSETDPYSSGLGFAVRAGRDFLGEGALPAAPGGPSRLVCLVLDDPQSVALGNEPVRDADETVVGRVSSGGLGYSLERVDRLRVVAGRARRGRHQAVGRGVRRDGGCNGDGGAALRPCRSPHPSLTRIS